MPDGSCVHAHCVGSCKVPPKTVGVRVYVLSRPFVLMEIASGGLVWDVVGAKEFVNGVVPVQDLE